MTILHAVFVAAAICSLSPPSRRWSFAVPIAAILAVTALALSASHFEHTIFTMLGAPSITTLALLISRAIRRCSGPALLQRRGRALMLSFLAVATLAVYLPALGFLNIVDVYRLGFLAGAPVVLAIVGIVLLTRREYGVAAVVLAALVALDFRLLPSVNVFDYVVDPIGGLGALLWASVRIVKRVAGADRAAESGVDPAEAETLEPA